MPNSDNLFGTYNKRTSLFSQIPDGSTALTVFADTDAAKAHFFTDEALAVWNETCTTLQWELFAPQADNLNTSLKVTFDFGTKGTPDIAESDDWAGQYLSRKTALTDVDNWFKNSLRTMMETDRTDHLF